MSKKVKKYKKSIDNISLRCYYRERTYENKKIIS